MQDLQPATTPGPVPKAEKLLRLAVPSAMPAEPEAQRALSLVRAANLSSEPTAARGLLRAIGKTDDGRPAEISLSSQDLRVLADRLREKGYPLTDEGISRFKLERGQSNAIRIGPELAHAVGRLFVGRDQRIEASPEDWARLGQEGQRALRLLLLLADEKAQLRGLASAFGVTLRHDSDGEPIVAADLAEAFCTALQGYRIDLTNQGLTDLADAQDVPHVVIDRALARFCADSLLLRGEPVHDYSRLTCQGATLNGRTLAMLSAAERLLGSALPLRIIKGSYDTAEVMGAHPHMGGGAADISVRGFSDSDTERVVQVLRQLGFAAWFRPREDRPHVHAIAIGDREMAKAAEWQVRQYFAGRDGRSRMAQDPHGGFPHPLPSWLVKYRLYYRAQ